MYHYTLRSLLVRRRRAGLTALAVLLGVAMVSGTFVFTDTIRSAFRQLFVGQTQGSEVVVSSSQGLYSSTDPPTSMPASLQPRIGKLPGVAAAGGQVADTATILGRSNRAVKNTGPPTLAVSYLAPPFTGVRFVNGGPPAGSGQVVLDEATAAREHYHVGDLVPIVSAQPVRRFQVSGIARIGAGSTSGAAFALFDLPTARALFNKQGLVDAIYVAGTSGTAPTTLEREIRPLLPPGVAVQSSATAVNRDLGQIADQLRILTGALEAFGFIAVFVGAFVIVNTLSITVAQRTRELALLRALGATRGQVLGSVIVEALTIGSLASLAGLLVGLAAAVAIRAVFHALGVELPSVGLVLGPRTVLLSLGVGVFVTVAAGLPPALRATRVSPVEALRESGSSVARPKPSHATIGAAIGLSLAGIALVFVSFGSVNTRLAASATGAVMLVLAAVLLSPLAVPRLSKVISFPLERRGRFVGRLARENTARMPTRTAITASSLMIGLALVLFVSVYINGVRASTRHAIDRTFVADFAIGSQDGSSSIPAASSRAVAVVPQVLDVSSIKAASGKIGAASNVSAEGVDPSTLGQVYRFDWVGGTRPALDALTTGDVLVERDAAQAAHLHVGQQVQVTAPAGLSAQVTVRGIYADRALLHGFTLPLAEFDQLFNQDRLQQVFVKFDPGVDLTAAGTQLQHALSDLPGVVARSELQLKSSATHHLNTVLALFYALLAMSIVMALIGILNVLTLSVHERTRELGILRALGMTPEQIRAMVRDESMITAVIGTAVGLVLGVGIAWIVTRTLSSQGVVFVIPWPQLGLLVAAGLVVGALAALPPAARAAKLDVLSAIAHE